MDLLYLSISDEDDEGGACVPYFILGRWEDLMDNEKEKVLAVGGTNQEETAEGEQREPGSGTIRARESGQPGGG